jgi:hypothetical protein
MASVSDLRSACVGGAEDDAFACSTTGNLGTQELCGKDSSSSRRKRGMMIEAGASTPAATCTKDQCM